MPVHSTYTRLHSIGLEWATAIRLALLLVVVASATILGAQPTCSEPLSQIQLTANYERLAELSPAEQPNEIEAFVAEACATTDQITTLAALYPDETDRLLFLQYSYEYVYDRTSYERAVNALELPVARAAFVRFVQQQAADAPAPTFTEKQGTATTEQPDTHCSAPASEAVFVALLRDMASRSYIDDRMATLEAYLGTHCMSTAQLIEVFEWLEYDSKRFTATLLAYPKLYDVEQFDRVIEEFQLPKHRAELAERVAALDDMQARETPVMYGATPTPRLTPPADAPSVVSTICYTPVAREIFTARMAELRAARFDREREELAHSLLQEQCLTTLHLREILQLYDFDKGKLELAQFAYPYIYDPNNYLQLKDLFRYERYARSLETFVEEQ